METTLSPIPSRTRPLRRLLGVGALALAIGFGAGACSDDTDSPLGADETTTTVEADPTSTTVPGGETSDGGSEPTDEGTPAGGTTGGGSTGGGTTGGGSTGGGSTGGGQTPASPPPVITSFVTPDSIDCHNGDFQQFSASWTTTGAASTTLSIDGPGVYNTYGPNETEVDLPFNCSSPHTFLLTATGADGQTATKSITLQPRNVQGADPEDEDEI